MLSNCQLKRLEEHKYSASGTSLVEPALQIFWRWLVEQIPLWIAPNALTFFGLMINVSTSLILCYYSPDAKTDAPGWAYLSCGLGLFFYQCLDAIDGKQARRTNSSSPLGELFDHGCDAVSTVFVVLATCIAVKLGVTPDWLFFQIFLGAFLFYVAHWQTYCSGTLHFGKVDVTESQIGSITVFMISGIFGTSIWDKALPIPYMDLQFRHLPVLLVVAGGLIMLQRNFSVIFLQGGIGRSGSTVADTSVLSPVIPILSVILLALVIAKKSTSNIFEEYPCVYACAFGLLAAKITNKLVVAHMSKSELGLLDTGFIGPGMLFLNQYFSYIVNEYYVLWACLIFCTADLIHYMYLICDQLCHHLNIYCFSLELPPRKAKNSALGKDKKMR